jgi:hypothetical protein
MEIEDVYFDRYLGWRAACADLAEAYRQWCAARRDDRLLASIVYTALLDREAAAATDYARAASELDAERAAQLR